MTSRNWLLVLNNPNKYIEDTTTEDFLKTIFEKTEATFCTGQLEKGEEGTPHIQFFLNFGTPVRASKIKKVCKHLHITKVAHNNGADDYCNKLETRLDGPFHFGIRPLRRNNKLDW